ncbi:BTAD domain-containing putative transcriptional regulator [Streptomyces antibioticus]|uniref:AfsR/SARP family transcriptional regulator n=1 Tax=Streptomyces antibioticus TaxID=1890 RepID=UPI0037112753
MRFTLLGPVRAWQGSTEIGLGTRQQRMVLCALLVRPGTPVTADELIDAVWSENPPASAVSALRLYVHRLRKALHGSEEIIRSIGGGYVASVPPEAVDLCQFQERVTQARRLRGAGETGAARAGLRSALALWQGTPLSGLPGRWADAQRTRLARLRWDTIELLLRAEVESGGGRDAVAELSHAVAEHPLDERFRELLMKALWDSGSHAAALTVYQDTKKLLAERLGARPSHVLTTLYQNILSAAPAERGPQGSHEVRRAEDLPLPDPWEQTSAFVGRTRETAQIEAVAGPGRRPGVGVCVISGSPGTGKTTLAATAARGLAAHYPDGRLEVNLRGFQPNQRPVTAEQALRTLLTALGVAAHRVPPRLDAQAALYRSLLAGKRMLIVLDNARDAQQVRPLLPGSSGCFTLITSRNRLSGLVAETGAHYLALGVFTPGESREALVRTLGSDRVGADPEATRTVIERSARLPLAIGLIAARAATRGEKSLAAVAAELRVESTVLSAIRGTEGGHDLRSVFSWSYEALSHDAARLFGLLSLVPASGCSLTAAASLCGLPVTRTRQLLAELAACHLVDRPAVDRVGMHDLLHLYAGERLKDSSSQEQRAAASARLLSHCLHTAYAAARSLFANLPTLHLTSVAEGSVPSPVDGCETAGAWFDAENETLCHVVREAGVTPGCETATWQLALTLMEYLQRAGRWKEQLFIQEAALAAAVRVNDRLGMAHVHRNLGRALIQTGDPEKAGRHLKLALTGFEQLGDPGGRARTHGNLALLCMRTGRPHDALPHVERAVVLFRAVGDRTGQASALNNLGWVHAQTGQLPQAIEDCHAALALLRETADRVATAATWDSLGYIHHRTGDHGQALHCYEKALALDRELGDEVNAADTLCRLAETRLATGDVTGAREAWSSALTVLRRADPQAADRVQERLDEV